MTDSILQVNQIKDKGGNATGITVADTTANISIGTTLAVNTINEVTSANGVTIDGLSLKDGNVAPASGKGIEFNSGGTSSLLDDYEEGTFTPTVSQGTLVTANGFYTKVGRMCICSFHIGGFSNTTSAARIDITNLPFNSSSDSGYTSAGSIAIYRWINHSHDQLGWYMSANTNDLQLWSSNKDGAYLGVSYNQLASGTYATIYAQVVYQTT